MFLHMISLKLQNSNDADVCHIEKGLIKTRITSVEGG